MVLNPLLAFTTFVQNKLGFKPDLFAPDFWNEIFQKRMEEEQMNAKEYYHYLIHSTEEKQRVVELVINPETWFFRDSGIYPFIQHRTFQASHLKILCLACSTGEEPYSIAMTLFNQDAKKQTFSIDAVDISHVAIKKAKKGIYRKNAFRSDDHSFREQYFYKTHAGYHIDEKIKENVKFFQANLLEDRLPFTPHSYQLILCRNLMIYLEPNAQKKVLELMKEYLTDDGLIFVGPAEAQLAFSSGFVPVDVPGTYAFRIGDQEITTKLELIEEVREPDEDLLNMAKQAADRGEIEVSRDFCFEHIKQFGASPEAYYLLGLLAQANGEEKEAEDFFRKAIYLNPHYYEALISLALICESKGELPQAERFRTRALKTL